MTSLNPSLRLALLQKAKGKKNIFQKGFTLVELMTVIVIVGVLSAVALPSFMSQSAKAKATEATTQITSVLKDAAAIHTQDSTEGVPLAMNVDETLADTIGTIPEDCTWFGAPEDANSTNNLKTIFDYECLYTREDTDEENDTTLLVTATVNDNEKSLKGNQVQMKMNLDTGYVERVRDETSKVFGGTKANINS